MSSLDERFPDMKPVTQAPGLYTVNGIGTAVYGRRDYDELTSSYVTTHVFCVVFIPLFTLGAYRVIDAVEGGWYFLGKVPLSSFARGWNWFVAASILLGTGLVVWQTHTGTEEYRASQQIAEADRLAAAGKIGQAAETLLPVARGHSGHAIAAVERIDGALDHAEAPPPERVRAYRAAINLHRQGKNMNRLWERGLDWSKKNAQAHPQDVLQLTEALQILLDPTMRQGAQELAEIRLTVLEKSLVDRPDDPQLLSELAVVYETRKDMDRCEKLLQPHARKLGTREGARILGQIYAHQDKFDLAYDLLAPYAQERLKKLHQAEKNWQDTLRRVDEGNVNMLRSGKAPGFDYGTYKAAAKNVQDDMVRDYLDKALQTDPDIQKARDQIRQEGHVVPVALDLGMVLLRRGQAATDPEVRKGELEKAEKTFLSVGGVAGQTDEFRLNLGQVYYWLGKHDLGKKHFDDLLKAQNRDPKLLVAVARLLREIGLVSESRTLLDEAYDKAGDEPTKFIAADLRSVITVDFEERITWLKRGNPADKQNQADLCTTEGHQASSKGQDEAAANHFRRAIEIYAGMPESAVSLNNGALVHFALFRMTGDRGVLDKGFAMLERAIVLKPGDSILLHNVADSIFANALEDVIGKDIDLRTLKQSGNLSLIGLLYNSAEARDQYRQKVKNNAGVARARAQYERALLLAPQNAQLYRTLMRLHGFTRDLPALQALHKRLQETELDHADAKRRHDEAQQGKNDEKLRQELVGLLPRIQVELSAARKIGGATWAAAAESWAGAHFLRETVGQTLSAEEIDQLVKLAEDVHVAQPSAGTSGSLMGALLLRAHHKLLVQDGEYAAAGKKTSRSLGATYLLAFLMNHEGRLQKLCLDNADVRRVQELVKDSLRRYPDDCSYWNWAVLRAAHPEEAARVAQRLAADEVYRLTRAITEKLDVYGAATFVDRYWSALVAGEEAQARTVLDEAARAGLELPAGR